MINSKGVDFIVIYFFQSLSKEGFYPAQEKEFGNKTEMIKSDTVPLPIIEVFSPKIEIYTEIQNHAKVDQNDVYGGTISKKIPVSSRPEGIIVKGNFIFVAFTAAKKI